MSVRLDNVELPTNLLLAPIAGYCDLAFRGVVRRCGGVGLAVTDLLCPEGVLRENYRSMQLAATERADRPLSMQLYGADPQKLSEAARWCEDHGADVVDINMGCPVDKITKRDGGSRLLCDPDRTVKLAERVARSLKRTPLTAKMRLGWDDSCIVAPTLARRLEEVGVRMVTIHGRTTQMRFTGNARLEGIAQVVAAVNRIPVVGNGDVRTPQDAQRMIRLTGCAGVMIGRAALSKPWLLRDTWSFLTTGAIPPEPTIYQKLEMLTRHFRELCVNRSERAAIVEFRKRVSWYAKTMHPCWPLREPMRSVRDAAQFEEIVSRFRDWRSAYEEHLRSGLRDREAQQAAYAELAMEGIPEAAAV